MPLLYSVGQHRALEAISRELLGSEKLLAYLDDIYVITKPDRVGDVYTAVRQNLWVHACVSINNGKTKVWNAAGHKPAVCEVLDRVAQAEDPHANVWRGSEVATERQGLLLLGAPLGHPDFVAAQLRKTSEEHEQFLARIPSLQDLQAAWLLLLVHCANARANYLLRVVPPDLVAGFAQAHDARLWSCLFQILGVAEDRCDDVARNTASLPLAMGGLGLRSAVRTSPSAFWASWADCLPMVQKRHPEVAACIVERLSNQPRTPCLGAAAAAAEQLNELPGFTPPSWHALALGARPPPREPEENEPGTSRTGWQHEASSRTERHHRDRLFLTMTESERAMVRSQGGPGAGVPFTVCPTGVETRIDPHLFRTLLLRRLRLPLSMSKRNCRCGRPLDSRGHHRAACARAGVLGRRGFAVESAAARVCREGGARVTTNVLVRDMDVAAHPGDARRLEVVADGLPMFRGVQFAIDTTLVSALRCDGSALPRSANVDGAALQAARRRKERAYPELVGPRGRARLVVLAGEVGGRWSEETRDFLNQLARGKVRHEPAILRRRVQLAWRMRWQAILSCSAAKAFAASLLELRGGLGADGTPPSYEVESTFRCELGSA